MAQKSTENLRTVNYRISAEFQRLRINKNFSYSTKILWKRHQNKAETKAVSHAQGFSVYNETLTLEFGMYYDIVKHTFLEKNVQTCILLKLLYQSITTIQTQIAPVIVTDSGIKSGGYAKFDLAEALNQDPTGAKGGYIEVFKKVPLTKCPDPDAYVEVLFKYQKMNENSTVQTSILDNSSREFNISRMSFSREDSKVMGELQQISATVEKLQKLSSQVKNKKPADSSDASKRISTLENENSQLKRTVANLEDKIKLLEQEARTERRDMDRQIKQLEKALDKKNKQINEKAKELGQLSTIGSSRDSQYEELYIKLKYKYQESEEQRESLQRKLVDLEEKLQKYEEGGFDKQYTAPTIDRNPFEMEFNGFGKEFSNEKRISLSKDFGSEEGNIWTIKIEQLEKDKVDLQNQVAVASHKIGQLFNMAYEIGGAKLLDRLQSCIGLIELV